MYVSGRVVPEPSVRKRRQDGKGGRDGQSDQWRDIENRRQWTVKDPMALVTDQTSVSLRDLEDRVCSLLPRLCPAELADMARIVGTLLRAFQPERIYVFGSRARHALSP